MPASQERSVRSLSNQEDVWEDAGTNTERLVFFSDAVFAIAMTLLVIDLRIPGTVGSQQELGAKLLELWPNLLGFTISFFVIGTYWRVHHRQFRYIKRYDEALLSLNFLLLFLIALIPFTTALISNYGQWQLAVVVYDISLGLASLVITAIWFHATSGHKLVDPNLNPGIIRHETVRNLTMSAAFFLVVLSTFVIEPRYAQWALLILVPIRRIEIFLEKRRKQRIHAQRPQAHKTVRQARQAPKR